MKAGYVLTKLDDENNGLSDWRPPMTGIGISPWLPIERFEQGVWGTLAGRRWSNMVAGMVELKGYLIMRGVNPPVPTPMCVLPLELRPVSLRFVSAIVDAGNESGIRTRNITHFTVQSDGSIAIVSSGREGEWPFVFNGAFYSLDDQPIVEPNP